MKISPRGSQTPIAFHLDLSADHQTGATGKASLCTVYLWKAANPFVVGTGSVTEIGGGDYEYTPAGGDTLVEGAFIFHVECPLCDPAPQLHTTAYDYILLRQTRPIPFFMPDVSDHITGKTGLTPTVTISKAGSALAAPAGTVAELTGAGGGHGWYALTPTTADTGLASTFVLHASATGADTIDDTYTITNPQVLWGSADLLARCKLHARRPAIDQATTDANWYALLTEAQMPTYGDLFSRYPELGYSDPERLTTGDGGLTYQFSELNEIPLGYATIYPDLKSIPDSPLVADSDYLIEATQIRMLGDKARSFPNGPYARYVLSPELVIDADNEPVLRPASARMLLVWSALEDWAARPGSGVDPSYYAGKYQRLLDTTLMQFATAYNQHAGNPNARWWDSLDLQMSGALR